MINDIELKLPFAEEEDARGGWNVDQEPTDLLALWPSGGNEADSADSAPTQTEVVAALRAHLGSGFQVLQEIDPPSPDIQWAVAARLPNHSVPVMLWAQPTMQVAAGELGDADAEACRWGIGVETLLEPSDPLSGYVSLMKALAGALPQSPAVIDINSTMIYSRADLDETFVVDSVETADGKDQIEPAADDLWMIHVVQADDGRANGEGGVVWLHTHGLWRCGLPELEMLEVPARHAATASELLNDIASLFFEFPPPPPGQPYEVGENLDVTFQPWQTIVDTMDPALPGGANDRREDGGENPHVGVRAVVCSTQKRGAFRRIWAWPQEVVEQLENDRATIYMTRRATQRQARMAQARWEELATAFAAAQRASLVQQDDPRAVFLVKAGFQVDQLSHESGSAATEHLWFEAQYFGADHADAMLINQPVAVRSLNRGDRVSVGRAEVSDWQVLLRNGDGTESFGPHDVAMLWRALDAMKNETESTV